MTDAPHAAQPDYGPSLPQLVGPRLRALSRRGRFLLGAGALLALVLLAGLLVGRSGSQETYVQSEEDARARGLEPISFHFDHSAKLRVSKSRDAYVVAERRSNGTLVARFSVSEFEFEPRPGLPGGYLPIVATDIERDFSRRFDGFRLQFEGRARVNQAEGYQFAFRARIPQEGRPPRSLLGRVVMLPEPYDLEEPDKPYPEGQAATTGVLITMLSTTLDEPEEPLRVGDEGNLQRPFRSFRFGSP